MAKSETQIRINNCLSTENLYFYDLFDHPTQVLYMKVVIRVS